MKRKLVLYLVLLLVIALVMLNITHTGNKHVGTVKENIQLVNENQQLTTENERLSTENEKLNAVVDSQATVISDVSQQLEKFTNDKPVKNTASYNNSDTGGEEYHLSPIEVP